MITISYSGYRFPPEIIQHAIWLYIRFTLSFRDVEDLLAERGIMVSCETVRRWGNHFGPMVAADLRKRRPKPHTTWHLDEVYLKICRMEDFAVRTKIDGSESATSCQRLGFVARRSKPKPDAGAILAKRVCEACHTAESSESDTSRSKHPFRAEAHEYHLQEYQYSYCSATGLLLPTQELPCATTALK